jgi:hypothetical protein
VNEIKKGEQEDPDQIDDVPVKSHEVDCGKVLRRKVSSVGSPEQPEQDTDAHDHVDAMQPCQAEVYGKENSHVGRLVWWFSMGVSMSTRKGMLYGIFSGIKAFSPQ